MGTGADTTAVTIQQVDNGTGFKIIDPIERRQQPLYTAGPVTLETASTDRFPFPVTTAVRLHTSALTIPVSHSLVIRNKNGKMLTQVGPDDSHSFVAEEGILEPAGLIKIYIQVTGEVEIHVSSKLTRIEFGKEQPVVVGARSLHGRPAETVTVNPTPESIIKGISTFSAALKTTSPERAFPSHRGHPPRLKIDKTDENIPDELQPPIEEAWVEVPPSIEAAFSAAPLAYYLGMGVKTGESAAIIGPDLEYHLDRPSTVQKIKQTLQKVFILDCVVRTEGHYEVTLSEREVIEQRISHNIGQLHEQSPIDRLRSYLEIPYEAVADQIPKWRVQAYLEPSAKRAEVLPFLVDDLAVIDATNSIERLRTETSNAFDPHRVSFCKQTDARSLEVPETDNVLEQVWIGEGIPQNATKGVPAAYEHRLGRVPSTDEIDISVVCNSTAMAEERDLVNEAYTNRDDLEFSISIIHDLTCEELRTHLAEQHDFLHFIGHIDEEGFECSDGRLDAKTLEEVGVDAFFLNACQSYSQGREIIRNGAIGGIVTLNDVINYGAVRVGRTIARTLNAGFPLGLALDLARDESVMGSQYTVVGDGSLSIVQPEGGTPILCRIHDDKSVSLDALGAEPGLGCMYSPHFTEDEVYHLSSGEIGELQVQRERLREFLSRWEFPVMYKDQLDWPDTVLQQL